MRTISLTIVAFLTVFALYIFWPEPKGPIAFPDTWPAAETPETPPTPSASSAPQAEATLPSAHTIDDLGHVWQSFNNCSSVALLIALSHFGITDTQEAIAEATRPWNNRTGDNDDKSVTLYELADYAMAKHGLTAYVRPNGNIETLKKFVAAGIPVVTRALTYPDKDYVHYRVVRGYDDTTRTVIESDGIEGPNQPYSYDAWMHMWKDFNYSYLIVVPYNQRETARRILGEEADERAAWANAEDRAREGIATDPRDIRAHYNLVTALYYQDDYAGTVREFERIESRLTPHKLWYQMEPIWAYFELKNYDRAIALSDAVINANNASVSELYVMKGRIYELRGNKAAARAEFEKALKYHKHLQAAKDALAALGA